MMSEPEGIDSDGVELPSKVAPEGNFTSEVTPVVNEVAQAVAKVNEDAPAGVIVNEVNCTGGVELKPEGVVQAVAVVNEVNCTGEELKPEGVVQAKAVVKKTVNETGDGVKKKEKKKNNNNNNVRKYTDAERRQIKQRKREEGRIKAEARRLKKPAWWTPQLTASDREVNRLKRRIERFKDDERLAEYRKARNLHASAVKKAKKGFLVGLYGTTKRNNIDKQPPQAPIQRGGSDLSMIGQDI